MDCVFCRIATGEIPTPFSYQDEQVVAFPDINPKAPVHMIIIPKKHIPSLNHVDDNELPLLCQMVKAAKQVAKDQGVAESGYRLVINTGKEGGQVVPHLHLHLLGGRQMRG